MFGTKNRQVPVTVISAITLRKRYPDLPALSILDAVFVRADEVERAAVLDNRSSPWFARTSPFAAVVAQAFESPWQVSKSRITGQFEGDWGKILQRLEDRYRQPTEIPFGVDNGKHEERSAL